MYVISVQDMLFMLIPIVLVGYIYFRWVGSQYEILIASLRMIIQLLAIGYVLIYLFKNDSLYLGVAIIAMMVAVSSLIALRNIEIKSLQTYLILFTSIAVGGTVNLLLVITCVLDMTPLYEPKYVIPIAGMIYANAMNAVSLAAERFTTELQSNKSYESSRAIALKASLIPQINAFLAVGLVSLPGMMTGQILSGVDPLIAVRYQIVVMAMILGSSGMSVVIYLYLKKRF